MSDLSDRSLNISGNRNVIIGRDVIKSLIIIGDKNKIFIGKYESLKNYYLSPKLIFERVKLKRFVGREWLEDKIDKFLEDNEKGLFILEAEAGLGKTTFLAYLVDKRGYFHHFVELAPGKDGIGAGLKNLAAQLIRAWELSPDEIPDPSNPTNFEQLLIKVAEKRNSERPDEKIVLVVDALDEAGTPPDWNVMGLPKHLPKGVYLIVSKRPVKVTLNIRDVVPKGLKLEAKSKENLDDMKEYLNAVTNRAGIKRALEENNIKKKDFVETLLNKSQGVWIYLHYILDEIEKGERSPLNLDALPNSLWGYYSEYWGKWRDERDWYEKYLPLLSTLAAIEEPIPFPLLCKFASVEEHPQIKRLLNGKWRPFLAISDDSYRLYHASLREFLEGKAPESFLPEDQKDFIDELAKATCKAHKCIAGYYLKKWGGLNEGLPGLKELDKSSFEDKYGLCHLVTHLAKGGQIKKLHKLMELEWKEGKRVINVWHSVKESIGDTAGYISDIELAWEKADKEKDIPKQCLYALIKASLNSLAQTIPVELLLALVKYKIWSPEQGLAYARQIPEQEKRTEALANIALYLAKLGNINEAINLVREIENKYYRAEALANIALYLDETKQKEILNEAIYLVRKIDWESVRAEAFANIAPYLAKSGNINEAIYLVREIDWESDRAEALANIAFYLAKSGNINEAINLVREIDWESVQAGALANIAFYLAKSGNINKAINLVRKIENKYYRAEAFANIAPYLDETKRKEILDEAINLVRKIENEYYRAKAFANIAPYLAKSGNINEAINLVREIDWESVQAKALANIAPYLAKSGNINEAINLVRKIDDEYYRAEAFANIAPYLDETKQKEILNKAINLVRKIENEYYRAEAFANIAFYLAKLGNINKAINLVREIDWESDRAKALANIAFYLAKSGNINEAINLVRKIENEYYRAKAFANIAPYLDETKRKEILNEAINLVRKIDDEYYRAEALANIAPYLDETKRKEILNKAINLVRKIDRESDRAKALANIAFYLAKSGNINKAINLVRKIDRESDRAKALANIAFYLAKSGNINKAINVIKEIEWEDFRAEVLVKIAPYFPESKCKELFNEALNVVRKIEDRYKRAYALANIASYLSEPKRREILDEALDIAREIEDEDFQAKALANIVPYLAKSGNIKEALNVIRKIEWGYYRAKALANIASYLSEPKRREILDEALDIAREIEDEDFQAKALANIVLYFAKLGYVDEALNVVKEIEDVAREIKDEYDRDEYDRAKALTNIAPYLAKSQHNIVLYLAKFGYIDEALDIIRKIEWGDFQAKALANIAPYLASWAKRARKEVYNKWCETLHFLAKRTRADMLSDLGALSPLIAELGGTKSLEHLIHIINQVTTWWP